METFFVKVFDASATLHTGPCVVAGFILGNMDGVNDPDVSFHHSVDNSGEEYVPENPTDTSAKGWNGAMFGCKMYFPSSCFVEIATAQVRVSVMWRPGM